MKTSSEPIEHAFDGEKPRTSGVSSSISFQNKDFMAGLRRMFNASDNEMIASMRIEDGVIHVYFDLK
jgi:hypothetical protein